MDSFRASTLDGTQTNALTDWAYHTPKGSIVARGGVTLVLATVLVTRMANLCRASNDAALDRHPLRQTRFAA